MPNPPKKQVTTRTVMSIGVSRMTETPSAMLRSSDCRFVSGRLNVPLTMVKRRTLAP